MQRVIENTIDIARSPQQVFDYVTQPWRWHEWHPSSRSARAQPSATMDTPSVMPSRNETMAQVGMGSPVVRAVRR